MNNGKLELGGGIGSGENYEVITTDSLEVKELKNKLKIIMNKLNTYKKDKEQLAKSNKGLQEEIQNLQCNLRQMISGFSNTSSAFPMQNELINQVLDFFKYDSVDIFFDLLCPELNMKGILYFYFSSLVKLNEVIANYFNPAQQEIKRIGCIESVDGPIMNVLRKSFQINYQTIIQKCLNREIVAQITQDLQNHLKLGGLSGDTQTIISNYLQKLGEILFRLYISDPPLVLDPKSIGVKVNFNTLKHDPFDGFIKNKEDCIIILPSIHKQNTENEMVVKALVLQKNYEIPN